MIKLLFIESNASINSEKHLINETKIDKRICQERNFGSPFWNPKAMWHNHDQE